MELTFKGVTINAEFSVLSSFYYKIRFSAPPGLLDERIRILIAEFSRRGWRFIVRGNFHEVKNTWDRLLEICNEEISLEVKLSRLGVSKENTKRILDLNK